LTARASFHGQKLAPAVKKITIAVRRMPFPVKKMAPAVIKVALAVRIMTFLGRIAG
jgi:hypothetical protein